MYTTTIVLYTITVRRHSVIHVYICIYIPGRRHSVYTCIPTLPALRLGRQVGMPYPDMRPRRDSRIWARRTMVSGRVLARIYSDAERLNLTWTFGKTGVCESRYFKQLVTARANLYHFVVPPAHSHRLSCVSRQGTNVAGPHPTCRRHLNQNLSE